MRRSTYRRVLSRASGACAATTLVWIALMGMASTALGSPGDTELVSISTTTGVSASGMSYALGAVQKVSADGRFVVFKSEAPDLVAVPSNGRWQIYIRDRGAGTTERISVTPSGLPGNEDSNNARISADGRYVVFDSFASDLIDGDTNGRDDVFVWHRQTGSIERVSVSSSGIQASWSSTHPSISADGRYVAFSSLASNLVAVDTNGVHDVFVRDRETGITTLVSTDIGTQPIDSYHPVISDDGRYVAFVSWKDSWVDNRIFVRARQAGTTERIDVSTSGEPGNSLSYQPALSADGRFVAFESAASNLVPGDTYGTWDVFVRDRVAGTTECVSVSSTGDQAEGHSDGAPSISADGRYVAFTSRASNLIPGDTNRYGDVFVRDRHLRTTARASLDSNGLQVRDGGGAPALSADGRFVAFSSSASNLVANDTNEYWDVFIHELGVPPPSAFGFAVKPTALAFGNQALFTSATLRVWVTNKGTTPLPITSVGLVGLNPGMFAANNRCGSSVAVGASCSVRVTFRPTSVGDKSAKLRVVAGDNDVRTKALAGTGVQSTFTVSPTSLDFGSVPIGTTTVAKVVTISNTGSASLPIGSITLAGWNPYQFAQTHNCPANLAVGAGCTINVAFKPTTPIGSKAALLNITRGGGAATRSVALAGAARR